MVKKIFERVKKEGEEVKKEVKQRVVGYLLAAFGLVAGLAWNDAVKGLIEYFFPLGKNSLLIKFAYAALITLIVVIVGGYLARLTKKDDRSS